MILVRDIRLPLSAGEPQAFEKALHLARIPRSKAAHLGVARLSVDARHGQPKLVYTIAVTLKDEGEESAYAGASPCVAIRGKTDFSVQNGTQRLPHRPVVCGLGPAGLFAALLLARQGYRPIVLERGPALEERVKAVEHFSATGELDENANIQFGEGGAGTFSDGKLTTRIGDELCGFVTEVFLEHGAPKEIAWQQKPHVGTDLLRGVITSIRKEIESLGGEVHFNTALTGFERRDGRLVGIRTTGGAFPCEALVFAVGHSARDTFGMLMDSGLVLECKPFSVGFRAEHLQSEIEKSLYHEAAGHPALPPYGIFRQAPHNIWGNIMIGLGSRLNVFQNKLADSITKYSEIDLEEPGRRKCAYFCIISDQDDTYRFLSSMFFSLLFIRLFDFARKSENRRLPVRVNVVMDEFCNIDLPNSKKYLSVSRSRNIDIQCVAQSVSQLADRYPRTEWQELVGDCDYQLFLGCNDAMTAEYISDQCGKITVRVNNTSIPTAPLAPGLRAARGYTESKISTGRPLMMPDEVRRLPRDKAILLVRGSKPLLLTKIRPEEHPDFQKLRYCKASDHIPAWRVQETEKAKPKPCASDAQSSASLSPTIETPPAVSGKEEYRPDADELDLHPPFDFSRGIDCKTLTEVSPKDL